MSQYYSAKKKMLILCIARQQSHVHYIFTCVHSIYQSQHMKYFVPVIAIRQRYQCSIK